MIIENADMEELKDYVANCNRNPNFPLSLYWKRRENGELRLKDDDLYWKMADYFAIRGDGRDDVGPHARPGCPHYWIFGRV